MDLGLRGLKALVTGGTRGIGRAIAETLAAEGGDAAICARNSREVAATVAVRYRPIESAHKDTYTT